MKPTQNYPLLLTENGMKALKSPQLSTEAESPFIKLTSELDTKSEKMGFANTKSWESIELAADSIKSLKNVIFERLISGPDNDSSGSYALSEISLSFQIGLEGESGVPFLAKGKVDSELQIQLKWAKN